MNGIFRGLEEVGVGGGERERIRKRAAHPGVRHLREHSKLWAQKGMEKPYP